MNSHPLTTESVAKALVINKNGDVLLLTIGEHKANPARSFKPDLPGGLVDPGESERDAVVREVTEETGIVVGAEKAQLAYAETEFYPEGNVSITKFLYLIFLDDDPEVTLSWEHSAFKWIPLAKLKAGVELRPFYEKSVAYCFTNGLLRIEQVS